METAAVQAWLAVSDDPAARLSGRYFHQQEPRTPHPAVADPTFGQRLIGRCTELSGVGMPNIG